ncbi:hypothetical protein WNY37_03610 [Henriciella sp. AS95]|uniref:hypothetical protein n=1 Tax=Henriciella sp. AS95 TaxID=3135782 RepID=UPI00316DC732
MTDEVEKYSRRRRCLLVAMALAFIVWQAAGFGIFDDIVGGDRRFVRVISIVAPVIWAGILIWLVGGKAMRDASASTQTALDDELVRANRAQAFTTGYWATLIASALVFAVSLFVQIPAHEAVQIVLITGVVAPMFAFAWLEGKGA